MKAVIMAGGSGKRLMPLTYSTPKPMVRLFSKPILAHIISLLRQNGFDDITLSLGYMAQSIEDYLENEQFEGVKIETVRETQPLGTAGGVKNAMGSCSEPFLVISGDCVCDFDLKKIMDFHLSSSAYITIACTRVNDPREYGVVEHDERGKVKTFTEKPPWSCAVSDLVNTGIYVLDPNVLGDIPEGKSFDFSGDLFPLVISQGWSILQYEAEGFWCDIGSPSALLGCMRKALDGEIELSLGNRESGIFLGGELPSGNFSIIPPCYIAKDVRLSDGAVIGPYSVIDEGCRVGYNSAVAGSCMYPYSAVLDNCSVGGSILCEKSAVKSGAKLSEGCVVGESSVVDSDCTVGKNVIIPAECSIEKGFKINGDIKSLQTVGSLTDFNSFSGRADLDFDSVSISLIGQAIASSSVGGRVGILTDSSALSQAAAYTLKGAMMSCGTHVWNFGEGFYTQLEFYTRFCSLKCGIFIGSKGAEVTVSLVGENGLPLKNSICRDIENRIKYRQFTPCAPENCRDVSDMTGVAMMYRREIVRQTDTELSDIGCTVKSHNAKIQLLLEDCLYRLGARKKEDLSFKINSYGNLLTAFSRDCGHISHDRLCAICLNFEMQSGHDVSVPFDSPYIFLSIAEKYGRKLYRFYPSGTDSSDENAREIARANGFMRDALFMCVKLLNIMCTTGKSLARLSAELPDFYVRRTRIPIDFSPCELRERLKEKEPEVTREGIRLNFESGRVLLTPSKSGKTLRILSEAANYELSKELTDEALKLLKKE